jgi:hypothetical protein
MTDMGLSDTLFEAQWEMIEHIERGDYPDDVNERAKAIVEAMDALRYTPGLDVSPNEKEAPPRRPYAEIAASFREDKPRTVTVYTSEAEPKPRTATVLVEHSEIPIRIPASFRED